MLALVATLAAGGLLMAARVSAKNRRERGGFSALPFAVSASQRYIDLSSLAKVLFHDLHFQFRGNNNGDLCAAWGVMKPRGWKSQTSLLKARAELLRSGFIVITRMGSKRRPHLYALTFLAIDECGGKLDCAPTKVPGSEWKLDLDTQQMENRYPANGVKRPDLRVVS